MEIHFLVMEKSWKIIVEKEWSRWMCVLLLQFSKQSTNESDDEAGCSCRRRNYIVFVIVHENWCIVRWSAATQWCLCVSGVHPARSVHHRHHLLTALALHLSSLSLTHRHHPRYEQLTVPFDMLHLISGTNSLFSSQNLIPVSLSLTHLFLTLSLLRWFATLLVYNSSLSLLNLPVSKILLTMASFPPSGLTPPTLTEPFLLSVTVSVFSSSSLFFSVFMFG